MTKPPPPPPRSGNSLPVIPRPAPNSWAQVLALADFPSTVIIIDFETFFSDAFSLKGKGMSTVEYVNHPDFEVLGCAFAHVDSTDPIGTDIEKQAGFIAGEEAVAAHLKALQDTYGPNLENCTVSMHNASFDAMILSRRYGIHPKFLIDTIALARHWSPRQKHGLDTLCKQFNLKEKGDTQSFKGLSFRPRYAIPKGRGKGTKMPVRVPLITEDQVAALAGYACNDVCRQYELLTILLPLLSNPVDELKISQHTLELWTKPTLMVDFEHGEKLLQQFEAEIDKAVEGAGVTREEISGNDTYTKLIVDALTAAGDDSQKYFKPTKNGGQKLADAKSDIDRGALLAHPDEQVRRIMAARVAVKSFPLHAARVRRIMAIAKADGGRLPVPLRYCGCLTGRFSGTESLNLQNLGARGNDLMTSVSQMIVAPEGKTLAILDFSSIEARLTAWLAGQTDLCDAFRSGEDIYSSFASRFFGAKVRKAREGGIPAIENLMKQRRQFGKVAILGLGYGMGAQKFSEYAGIDLTSATSAVKLYRETYAAIPDTWREFEKAFIYVAKYRRPCDIRGGVHLHALDNCDVVVTLPGHHELKYHKVRLVADRYGGDKIEVYNDLEKSWGHTWGGELFANCVQAMARDLLVSAVIRCEAYNFHVALHVHDSIVVPVDKDGCDFALRRLIDYMTRTPPWAKDCPISAEGKISDSYG